jgi:hypothetical protein
MQKVFKLFTIYKKAMDSDDIIFVVNPKSSDGCKVCGKEYDDETFYKYRPNLCKSCFSKECNFCRIRKILIRVFKELNVDRDTAIKILQKERNRIFRKILTERDEKVVVI